MGWTVLYIAFGIVALWLLGEVLLQYKARLRWRLLAFAGFSTVVAGVVALSSVVVIALGAAAFAVGQTFVTLSYRRGFSTGWALGGMPGSSRRRKEGEAPLEGEDADPVLEVSGVEEHGEYAGQGHDAYGAQLQDPYGARQDVYEPPTYEPQPMPDETGEYGIYDRDDQSVFEPAGYGTAGYGQQEQPQYAPYSDPYVGHDSGQYATTASYDAYGQDAGYGGQQGYPGGGHGAGHDTGGTYGTGYDAYGGVWVPQQRETDQQPVAEQQYGYGDGGYGAAPGYGQGYGEQAYGGQTYGTGYGYDYPYAAGGYPAAEGYGYGQDGGNGYDAGGQGHDPAAGGYGYDEQRGY